MTNWWRIAGHIWAFCGVAWAVMAVIIGGFGLEFAKLADLSIGVALFCGGTALLCWRKSCE